MDKHTERDRNIIDHVSDVNCSRASVKFFAVVFVFYGDKNLNTRRLSNHVGGERDL